MNHIKFSIIIVSYNTKMLLGDCLWSIFGKLSGDFEVIVVDNASNDGSQEMLKKDFAGSVKLIESKKNLGFGPANNLAAKQAQGEFLFFLNSDTILKQDILPGLADFLADNKDIGVVTPKLLLTDGREQLYAYGRFPTILNSIIKSAGLVSHNNSWFTVDWVSGAALIIRRDLFERIGGFDEKYFMYFEDIDLCRAVYNLGFKAAVLPTVSLIHLGGKSLRQFGQRKAFYYQSQNYFYLKHYGWFRAIIMRLIRWPYRFYNLRKK